MTVFRSAGCVLLHVVFSTRCCGCSPTEPVCSLVHCVLKYGGAGQATDDNIIRRMCFYAGNKATNTH